VMRYIISESQSKNLKKSIFDFFDKKLTPYEGWLTNYQYINRLEKVGKYKFYLGDVESDVFDDSYFEYISTFSAKQYPPPPDVDFQELSLPYEKYNEIVGYFGDVGIEYLKEWFRLKTGLTVSEVSFHYY
jgi:hypothetical protein